MPVVQLVGTLTLPPILPPCVPMSTWSLQEADFFLKNVTSFLLHPDTDTGAEFWQAVFEPPPAFEPPPVFETPLAPLPAKPLPPERLPLL